MLGGIFGAPAVDGDGVAGFLVIVRKDGRELRDGDVRGKFFPTVIEPGLWVESVVIARADWIVPIPGTQGVIRRMSGGENFRDAIRIAFGFLKHRKLIGPDGLVFVDAGFHVPASEVAAIGTRESAGAKTADGRALPKTIVDMAGVERCLLRTWACEGRTD